MDLNVGAEVAESVGFNNLGSGAAISSGSNCRSPKIDEKVNQIIVDVLVPLVVQFRGQANETEAKEFLERITDL